MAPKFVLAYFLISVVVGKGEKLVTLD